MSSKQDALRIIGEYLNERENEPAVPSGPLAQKRLPQACALVERFTPDGSAYRAQLEQALKTIVVGGLGDSNTPKRLEKVEGILLGLKEDIQKGRVVLPTEVAIDTFSKIDHVLLRFHKVARALQERRGTRKPLKMDDEFDVQYLLNALLAVEFDDVRPEEWTPSNAGSSGKRMDFLLKENGIVLEVKRTRTTLKAKHIGDELLIDIGHYRSHKDCRTLICFVYDPEQMITNPVGMVRDLEKQATPGMAVRAVVCQH